MMPHHERAGPGRAGESVEQPVPDRPDGNAAEARTAHDDAPESADFTDYSSGSSDGDWGGSGGSEDDDFYPQQVATNTLRCTRGTNAPGG